MRQRAARRTDAAASRRCRRREPFDLDVLARDARPMSPAISTCSRPPAPSTPRRRSTAAAASLVVREDVGRHNAVDKVIGSMLLDGLSCPATELGLFVSGRASIEMVQKAWAAGFATLVAVSAPTSLAVEAARRGRLVLAGFVRGDSFNVYAPERLANVRDGRSLRRMRMEAGLSVVHLFCKPSRRLDREAVTAAVKAAEADECQVHHRGDRSGTRPTWRSWRSAPDCAHLAHAADRRCATPGVDIVDSYVSITEVSEYAKGMPEEMLRARVYPQLPPEGNAFCFYPMSKKREGHANWYATPFDERNDMMREHGKSGRTFAGRVVQLVTGSTGLDDFEWGVTLFANEPRRHQGRRVHDALRQGVGAVRRVRRVLRRLPRFRREHPLSRRSTRGRGSSSPTCPGPFRRS